MTLHKNMNFSVYIFLGSGHKVSTWVEWRILRWSKKIVELPKKEDTKIFEYPKEGWGVWNFSHLRFNYAKKIN